MSSRRQTSIRLGGRYRQVSLYTYLCPIWPLRDIGIEYSSTSPRGVALDSTYNLYDYVLVKGHFGISKHPRTAVGFCIWRHSWSTHGWGLLNQFPVFRYLPFSALSKHTLAIEYHVKIWQMSPQLRVHLSNIKASFLVLPVVHTNIHICYLQANH